MIPIETAENILNTISCHPEVEAIPLMESLGRILAQDIVSRISMPPFDKSAMDGYAIRSDDPSPAFNVVEVIAAGSVPTQTIETGQCAKIMTGAMLPHGADRVVKVEVTEETDGVMTITGKDPHSNICYLGEDIKPGDLILSKGHRIRPQEVGIIASMGLTQVTVYQKPRVGLVTTGSEIVEPGSELQTGQIYNSNAYSIGAQVLQAGASITYAGIVGDDPEMIRRTLDDLLSQNQMVLISGGVSMGDYDFVPRILKELGVQLYFDKVAIQPGKPTVFGTRGETFVFGMPGNPVSTFIVFEVFVKRLLCKLMGVDYTPMILKGIMKKDFHRKRAERTAYIPVTYDNEGVVDTLEYHGSAHLNALSPANALLKVPTGVYHISKGSTVYVRQV
ncbi:MAG: gephyrin-like molybdotransferase Glp [Candidatus Omnitrophota bacterium]